MVRQSKSEEIAELVKTIEDARATRLFATASYLKIAEKPRWIQPVLRGITKACISLLAWVERWARNCINHIMNE